MGRRSVAESLATRLLLGFLVNDYPFPVQAALRISLRFRILHRRFSMGLGREMVGEIFSHEMLPCACRSCCSGR